RNTRARVAAHRPQAHFQPWLSIGSAIVCKNGVTGHARLSEDGWRGKRLPLDCGWLRRQICGPPCPARQRRYRTPVGGSAPLARPRAAPVGRRAMARTTPPYRADHVGSFLRPQRLLEARERRARGEIDAAALRAIEDDAIREVVRRQEEVGLEGITDGEFRRTFFHVDFLEQLDGVEVVEGSFTATFRRDDGTEVGFKPPTMRVVAPLRHAR